MTALFLAPHNDDEILFGAFTLLRHRPHVVICLRSYVQEDLGGPDWQTREAETSNALALLDSWLTHEQLPVRDDAIDSEMLTRLIVEVRDRIQPDVVFAPSIEFGGSDHHNLIGERAVFIFGSDRVVPYLTYTNGGKSEGVNEVQFEDGWPAAKLRAMSAYHSQIAWEPTRRWFMDEGIREWYE